MVFRLASTISLMEDECITLLSLSSHFAFMLLKNLLWIFYFVIVLVLCAFPLFWRWALCASVMMFFIYHMIIKFLYWLKVHNLFLQWPTLEISICNLLFLGRTASCCFSCISWYLRAQVWTGSMGRFLLGKVFFIYRTFRLVYAMQSLNSIISMSIWKEKRKSNALY